MLAGRLGVWPNFPHSDPGFAAFHRGPFSRARGELKYYGSLASKVLTEAISVFQKAPDVPLL